MFYYRFRSSSELAMKELMYHEIYFASTKECNDPFDGKTFLVFETDKDKWKRFFEFAWNELYDTQAQIWADELSEYLTGIDNLTYDSALNINYAEILQSFKVSPNPVIATILEKLIIDKLEVYKPQNAYFASFSHENDNLLMWAHYASMHQGYCLIFKARDNKLYQDQRRIKKSISKDSCILGSSCNWGVPDSFSFHDVSYSLKTITKNAFYYLPQYVVGRELNEEEKKDFNEWKLQQCLEKHDCWKYEKESRLILHSPSSWFTGKKVEFSQHERLFHYSPNQLVGIILGAKMDEKQKLRIREIIKEHIEHITENPVDGHPVFDFVLCQAVLPDNQRKVIIREEEIFTSLGVIDRNNKNFEKQLQNWKDGWGFVKNEDHFSKKQF